MLSLTTLHTTMLGLGPVRVFDLWLARFTWFPDTNDRVISPYISKPYVERALTSIINHCIPKLLLPIILLSR